MNKKETALSAKDPKTTSRIGTTAKPKKPGKRTAPRRRAKKPPPNGELGLCEWELPDEEEEHEVLVAAMRKLASASLMKGVLLLQMRKRETFRVFGYAGHLQFACEEFGFSAPSRVVQLEIAAKRLLLLRKYAKKSEPLPENEGQVRELGRVFQCMSAESEARQAGTALRVWKKARRNVRGVVTASALKEVLLTEGFVAGVRGGSSRPAECPKKVMQEPSLSVLSDWPIKTLREASTFLLSILGEVMAIDEHNEKIASVADKLRHLKTRLDALDQPAKGGRKTALHT